VDPSSENMREGQEQCEYHPKCIFIVCADPSVIVDKMEIKSVV